MASDLTIYEHHFDEKINWKKTGSLKLTDLAQHK